MNAAKRSRVDPVLKPASGQIPWAMMYLRLGLDCDYPIFEALFHGIQNTQNGSLSTSVFKWLSRTQSPSHVDKQHITYEEWRGCRKRRCEDEDTNEAKRQFIHKKLPKPLN